MLCQALDRLADNFEIALDGLPQQAVGALVSQALNSVQGASANSSQFAMSFECRFGCRRADPRCGERDRTRADAMHSRASSLPQLLRDAFASKLAPTAAASAATTCAWAATNGCQRLGLEAAHIKWFQARGSSGGKLPRTSPCPSPRKARRRSFDRSFDPACWCVSVGVIDNVGACWYLLQHEGRSVPSHARDLR